MELELHQVERRYEGLRSRNPRRERQLLSSLSELGQQMPIVVVPEAGQYVLIDGYKRLRALRQLSRDTVQATSWSLAEPQALLLERVLRHGQSDSAIEQGWFLLELCERFGLSQQELSERFGRTTSWVSRRIGLVKELPASVQQHVQSGAIGAHAAMKYLLPLARANTTDCEKLATAVATERPTSRQLSQLHATYMAGNEATRKLVVDKPMVVLRAAEQTERDKRDTALSHLQSDLRIIAAVSRRARARMSAGALDSLGDSERATVRDDCEHAFAAAKSLRTYCVQQLSKEPSDAGPVDPVGDPEAA